MLTDQTQWSLGHGKPLVPSRWQATQDLKSKETALLLYMWVAGAWYGSFRLTGPQASMTVASVASGLRKP
jgi:hypothetical protein